MKKSAIKTHKIHSNDLSDLIELNLDRLSKNLPNRIPFILNEFVAQDLKASGEIDLFEVLVKVLLIADAEPTLLITDLMGVLHKDDCTQLEDWTISKCGNFIKDFLQKDEVLSLFNKENCELEKGCEAE